MALSVQRVTSYIRHLWNQRVRLSKSEQRSLQEILTYLSPSEAQNTEKIRIGTGRDGSYVMLNDFQGVEIALSLGVGPDVSWDLAIAEKGISVWQFDHTVDAPPKRHPLCHFEKSRIVSDQPHTGEVCLSNLLVRCNLKSSILKIDIEGDEWKILSELAPSLLQNCRQIVVEFHDFQSISSESWKESARKALTHLNQQFGVVHVHGNNLSKHLILDKITVPDCLEVTFANRRFYELIPTTEIFPGVYDKKNNPYFPDFSLGAFQFGSRNRSF